MIYVLICYDQYVYFRRILPMWTRRRCLSLAHMEARCYWRERHKWGAMHYLVNRHRWQQLWKRRAEAQP